jgi:hypothetical protein
MPASPHSLTTQKTNIDIFAGVRTRSLYLTVRFRKLKMQLWDSMC